MPTRWPELIASRRQALTGLAASAVTPLGAFAAAAQTPGNVCILTPQADDGPFYFDPKLVRTDITEGRKGAPLLLALQALDAATCAPIQGARIDIWHADAIGYYSGYPGQGDDGNVSTVKQTFMRGTQFADERGHASFRTVYPGWYRGRTAHIHFKIFLDDRSVSTGQIYFPDALSEFLYRNIAPYTRRKGARDTTNLTDGVLRADGGHASFCSIKEEADHYLATLVVGIDRSGTAALQHGPGAPRRPRGRGSLVPGLPTE